MGPLVLVFVALWPAAGDAQDATPSLLSLPTAGSNTPTLLIGAALLILFEAVLIGGLLLERWGRGRTEQLLAERLRFETVLSEQSATLSRVPPAEVDGEIHRALRRITDFFGADWGSLTEFSHDGRAARITRAWTAQGETPSLTSLDELPWVAARCTPASSSGSRESRTSRRTMPPGTD